MKIQFNPKAKHWLHINTLHEKQLKTIKALQLEKDNLNLFIKN